MHAKISGRSLLRNGTLSYSLFTKGQRVTTVKEFARQQLNQVTKGKMTKWDKAKLCGT